MTLKRCLTPPLVEWKSVQFSMKGQKRLQPVNTFRWEYTVNFWLADAKYRDWAVIKGWDTRYDWACLIFPWCYGWNCLLLKVFTHKVSSLLYVHVWYWWFYSCISCFFCNNVWKLLVKKSCGGLSINRSVNQSNNQTINQTINQSIKQSINQSIYQSDNNHSVNQ